MSCCLIPNISFREPDIIVYCMEKNKDESYPGEGDTCIGIKYEDPRTGWNVVCPPFCIEKRHLEELILIIRRSLDTVRCKAYKKKIDKRKVFCNVCVHDFLMFQTKYSWSIMRN